MLTHGSDSSSPIAAPDDRAEARKGLDLIEKVELVVVLLLAVLPALFSGLATYYNPQLMQGRTEYLSGSLIVESVSVSSVVLYLIWRSKQSWELAFTFLDGVLFGAAFLIWRRLWPLVVAHTLINMWAFFGA